MAREDFHHLHAVVDGLPGGWRPPPDLAGAHRTLARPVGDFHLVATGVEQPLGRTPRVVAHHHDVIASLLEARGVLPLGVGTVVPAAELPDWLATRLLAINSGLMTVRGKVEMRVRLVRLDAVRVDGTARFRAFAESLVERADLPMWRYTTSGREDSASAALAFLLPREAIGEFLTRLAPVASRAVELAVVFSGPWAPYSFAPGLAESVAESDSVGRLPIGVPIARAG